MDRVFGSISLLGDINKNVALSTLYGQLNVAQRHEDILCRFEYNNSTEDVTITTSGTGASSNANSMAVASTGAGVGACKFTTVRSTTYRPAHEIHSFISIKFSTAAANTEQRAGLYDAQDGFFFGYSGTQFGLTIRNGGSDTFVPQSSWNRDKADGATDSKFLLDPTKGNQYAILFGWLGYAPVIFMIYAGAEKGWIPCHVYDVSNTGTTPSILSPSLPITWEAIRTSGSGAVTVSIGSLAAGRAVGEHSHAGHRSFAARLSKTLVAGVETYVASFRNNSTFQSKLNKVRIELTYFGAATDGTKSAEFLFRKNSTLTTPTWTEVDATNSVVSYDTTAAAFSGGALQWAVPMAKVDRVALDAGAGHLHLELMPGESMSITGLSAGASDVIISFRWEEYFA